MSILSSFELQEVVFFCLFVCFSLIELCLLMNIVRMFLEALLSWSHSKICKDPTLRLRDLDKSHSWDLYGTSSNISGHLRNSWQ